MPAMVPNRRPKLELVAPAASPEEAAAVIAAVEQFLRDHAPPPAPAGPATLAAGGAARPRRREAIDRGPYIRMPNPDGKPPRFCYLCPDGADFASKTEQGANGSPTPRSTRTSPGTSSRSSSASSTTSTTRPSKFLDGETPEDEFIKFRLKQGVYGQRQPDVQMIRVKLPFGGVTPEQMEAFAERDRAVRAAQQGPHHDAPEHPDPPHPAGRRGEGDPRDLRLRPVLARGLRQHGAQRHRRPVGGRLRGRAVRPDPLRGRLRALLRAPPHDAADAAQGQDRVHGHRRRQRDHRHPRHRLHPAHPRRHARLRDARRRRHVDHAPHRPHALRLRGRRRRRVPASHRGRHADLRPPGLAARQPRPRPHQGASSTRSASRRCASSSTRSWRATGSPSATSTPR